MSSTASHAIPLALLICCAAAAPSLSSAQDLPDEQYVHDSWSIRDGLPDAVVRALERTRDGYLWVGTTSGLARFDGVRFQVFNSSNTEVFRNDDIRALLETRDGALWIGTFGGGLVRRADGRFTRFTTADGLAHDIVYGLAEDRDGSLLIGTGAGVSRLRDGSFTNYPQEQRAHPDRVRPIAVDADGQVWAGTFGSGLLVQREDAFRSFEQGSELGSDIVLGLQMDEEGSLWVATYGAGIARLSDGEIRRYTTADGLTDDRTTTIATAGSDVWIGSYDRGVIRISGDRVEPLLPDSELATLGIQSLLVDSERTLWVGTSGGGLHAVRRATFNSVTAPEGSAGERVYSVDPAAADEGVWIGFEGGGVVLWDGTYRQAYTAANGLPTDDVVSVLTDRQGTLWVGTFGGGLSRIRNGMVTVFGSADGVSDIIFSLTEGGEGDLWIGTVDRGLVRHRDGHFTAYTPDEGLAGISVHTAVQDRHGRIWAGTSGGLSRLEGGRITSFTVADGLPADVVYALHEDGDGDLWIGTKGGGLGRHRDGRFFAFSVEHGLDASTVSGIVEDERGDLWLCTTNRILRVSRDALNRVAAGERDRAAPTPYGPADGVEAGGCSSGTQPVAGRADDGRLWFGTRAGAVSVQPGAIPDDPPPTVHIEEVIAAGQHVGDENGIRLPTGARDVAFRYTAPDFRAPDAVRFRYRLEGYDEDWVEAGSRRVTTYTNLGPGEYSFRVAAANRDGVWSESDRPFGFMVPARFHETAWFFLLLLAGAVAIVFFGYRTRVSQMHARREELESLVAQRTAEQRETARALSKSEEQLRQAQKMEALGRMAGGVAHDFNNLLTAISGNCQLIRGSISPENPLRIDVEEIEQAASTAASLTGQLLAFSRKQMLQPQVLDLNEVVKRMHNLLRRMIPANTDLVIELDPGLGRVKADPGQLEQVLMNLTINARDATPGGGTITIATGHARLRPDSAVVGEADVRPGSYVRLDVSDTGSGIDPATLDKIFEPFFSTKEDRKGTGLGLATVYGIVAQSGGHMQVATEPGVGTTMSVLLPRVDSPAVEDEAEERSSPRAAAGRGTVLVAEDEPSLQKLISRVLSREGYQVLIAADGLEALRLAQDHPGDIHLLVTDVIMPRMTGRELAERLSERWPMLPVLFISGYTDDVLESQGLGSDQHFLSKPFTLEVLRRKVQEIIQG